MERITVVEKGVRLCWDYEGECGTVSICIIFSFSLFFVGIMYRRQVTSIPGTAPMHIHGVHACVCTIHTPEYILEKKWDCKSVRRCAAQQGSVLVYTLLLTKPNNAMESNVVQQGCPSSSSPRTGV